MAPIAHQAGWAYTFLLALYTGPTTVIVGRGDPERMLDTHAAEGVTITFAVPTHALDLLQARRARPGRWDLKLRYVLTGTTSGWVSSSAPASSAPPHSRTWSPTRPAGRRGPG